MLIIAAFWLVMVLPGFALLWRLRCPWLAYGLPSTVTLSYLTSFALLCPISIAGYAFNWPLQVLSGAVLVSVVVAAALLLSDRRLRGRLRRARPSWWALLVSLLIVGDAVLGLRSGAHTAGDAAYHIARVRMLLDYGLNNWDPMVAGHRFDAIYHTNLYHALLAVSAQLSGKRATEAWVYSWMFAKLVTPGATYFLSFAVLRRRWLAWLSAGMLSVWMFSNAVMSYPNTLAAFMLGPIAIGLAVEAWTRGRSWLPACGFAGLALVSVQVHGLYYVLWCSLVGPALVARLAYLALRRRPGWGPLLASVLALGAGVPWLVVNVVHRPPDASFASPPPTARPAEAEADAEPGTEAGAEASPPQAMVELEGLDRGFLRLRDGLLMFDPRELCDVRDARFQLLLATAAGLCSRRRKQFFAFGSVILTLLAILYVPWVCTAFIKLAGAPWIVKRFVIFHEVGHDAICPAVFFLLVPPRFAGNLLRIVACALALTHGWIDGVNYSVWTHTAHWKRAMGHGRTQFLSMHAARRVLFKHAIARAETVVTRTGFVPSLLLDCPCYPLALGNVTRGVMDMDQRRADVMALLGDELDLPARAALLRHYGVRYIVLTRAPGVYALRRLYKPLLVKQQSSPTVMVWELDPQRPLPSPEPAPPSPEPRPHAPQ